jgi:hypothetical protein
MITDRLDENDDMTFGNGLQDYVTGMEATKRRVKNQLLFVRGDWVMDVTEGIPYIANTIIRSQDLMQLKELIVLEIQKIEGVRSVKSIDIIESHKTRQANITVVIVLQNNEYFELSV